MKVQKVSTLFINIHYESVILGDWGCHARNKNGTRFNLTELFRLRCFAQVFEVSCIPALQRNRVFLRRFLGMRNLADLAKQFGATKKTSCEKQTPAKVCHETCRFFLLWWSSKAFCGQFRAAWFFMSTCSLDDPQTSWQYPDDNNHYITFDENDMIARVPHPQDSGTVGQSLFFFPKRNVHKRAPRWGCPGDVRFTRATL